MRGTPLLLQLMFVFYVLPQITFLRPFLTRHAAIYISFVLNYSAYFAEIIRGGIQSIDVGQFEAGKVLGLSKSFSFIHIILPQVIKNVLPSISNEVITLVKDTTLVHILGVYDILKAARSVSNKYVTFMPYIFVGMIYLVIVFILTKIFDSLEKRYSYYR